MTRNEETRTTPLQGGELVYVVSEGVGPVGIRIYDGEGRFIRWVQKISMTLDAQGMTSGTIEILDWPEPLRCVGYTVSVEPRMMPTYEVVLNDIKRRKLLCEE